MESERPRMQILTSQNKYCRFVGIYSLFFVFVYQRHLHAVSRGRHSMPANEALDGLAMANLTIILPSKN